MFSSPHLQSASPISGSLNIDIDKTTFSLSACRVRKSFEGECNGQTEASAPASPFASALASALASAPSAALASSAAPPAPVDHAGNPNKMLRKRKHEDQDQQYAKLRYMPNEEQGKYGCWFGMTTDGDQHAVYRKGFKAKHCDRCLAAPGVWVKIPPGDARESSATDACENATDGDTPAVNCARSSGAGLTVRGFPEVVYRQGRLDSCVFSSAASAIAFLGDKGAAVVASLIPASLKHSDPMALLHDTIRSKKLESYEVVRRFKRGRLDILSDISSCPTTVQLLSDDGSVGHAVTIVNDLIFDATEHFSMPLSRESLDVCCGGAKFVCVERAIRYQPMRAAQKGH
jgi:hypothetical protein